MSYRQFVTADPRLSIRLEAAAGASWMDTALAAVAAFAVSTLVFVMIFSGAM